jgi:2,5-diamino-6-(ribosylamino)-4(3H)-pyrimidinone 5'-phosphate reductase
MTRPRVVCHMATSLDGRIIVRGWPDENAASIRSEYETVHATFAAQGWICGRVTMEAFAKRLRPAREVELENYGTPPREDFKAAGDFSSFAFAVDPRGRLAWDSNVIEGDHVVAVLSTRVSDAYLASLREVGVSYLLAGSTEIDFPLALERIAESFGVRTLMLEGGGILNSAMLRAGVVDEISVLVAPVADGRAGSVSLFQSATDGVDPRALELMSADIRSDGIVWLRYKVRAL